MKLFTCKWSKLKKYPNNKISLHIKAIDLTGRIKILKKIYNEWIGIFTNEIDEVMKIIKNKFGYCYYERLGNELFKPTFPIFDERVKNNNMDYTLCPFYKIYLNANSYDVGTFLSHKYNVSYYEEDYYLTRIYLDFYYRFHNDQFYYAWYEISEENSDLIISFQKCYMNDMWPLMNVVSFDLETVSNKNRIPNGMHPDDIIVMISSVTSKDTTVFYLLPEDNINLTDDLLSRANTELTDNYLSGIKCIPFKTELDLIVAFLESIQDPNILILTGYNIVNFDIPCLISRLAFHAHNGSNIAETFLYMFTSRKIGKHVIATFRKKNILDMYYFILEFSSTNLTDFKLDSVASARLNQRKVPLSPTIIHKLYQDKSFFDLKTFIKCLKYNAVDSELVLQLLRKENALDFLISRANMCTFNLEESLYFGNTKYIECVLRNYGTKLGFFVDLKRFRNINRDHAGRLFSDFANVKNNKNRYQGALNFCKEMSFHTNVVSFDFESLFPSVTIVNNLSPDTATVVSYHTYKNDISEETKNNCIVTNYRIHNDSDFKCLSSEEEGLEKDKLIILSRKSIMGFIPSVLLNLRDQRRKYKKLMVNDSIKYMYYYNFQLMYKLLMNSMYGCFGSENSLLSNISIALSITFFARKILLASYHYCLSQNYCVIYCDTDSIFITGNHNKELAQEITNYLGHAGIINLQKEAEYKSMLIISKKKYCVRTLDNCIITKGFEKKSNPLVISLVNKVLEQCFYSLENKEIENESTGWGIIQNLLQTAFIECRSNSYYITRKVKPLENYSTKTTAPHVRLMKRLPDFQERSIDFFYIFTDISTEGNRKQNPRSIEEMNKNLLLDFGQLLVSQKKNILSLINIAYFNFHTVKLLEKEFDKMIKIMRWKQIVNIALLYKIKHGTDLLICFFKDLKYSIEISR